MPTRADEIIDRRRLRRKLTFWRVAALAFVALAVVVVVAIYARGDGGAFAGDQVARVTIDGTITEDDALLEELEQIRKAKNVKGVILSVDSPGGTTAGGEAIFDAVRRIAAEKPVVAQVGTLAASAGYMIATAADRIVSRQTSIVGSIGVLIQYPDVTGLMDKIGVKLEGVKSSPLKAEPSPFNPTTEEERAMIRRMIMDSYDWFVDLVTDRRPLTRSEVLALADGSVFTGSQALERKLVDELGGELEARHWLNEQGVDPGLEIVDWHPRKQGSWLLNSAVGQAARLLGLSGGAEGVLHEIGADRIFLDGLLSVWQPDMNGLAD